MLPNPESYLNDCKLLIEMASNEGVELELQTAILVNKCFVTLISTDAKFIGVANLPHFESAIVEAFLKWRGRL